MLNFTKFLEPLDDLYEITGRDPTKTFNRIAGQVTREAARNWLRYIIPRVPVETGMAVSTFMPMARFLNNVTRTFTPARKPYKGSLYYVSPAEGERRVKWKIHDGATNNGVYGMEFQTSTLHWFLSQYYKGSYTVGEILLKEADEIFFQDFETRLFRRLNIG